MVVEPCNIENCGPERVWDCVRCDAAGETSHESGTYRNPSAGASGTEAGSGTGLIEPCEPFYGPRKVKAQNRSLVGSYCIGQS